MKQKFSHLSIIKFDEKMNNNTDNNNTNAIDTIKSLNKIKWLNNDSIVITGISGRYPEADNIEEFWDKLMKGIPLYTCDDRRWPVDFMDIPKNQGKLKDITKIDASFFNIKPSDANFMDPQIRILHEVIYEAIFDAGIDPIELRGSKTGLFLGMCYDDTHAALLAEECSKECYKEFSLFSVSKISYIFDFKGPTTTIDTACASSLSAFHQALCSIKSGQSDQCIVAGVAIHLRPSVSYAFHSLKMLSDDGKSKCLDASADGYCRSESVVALLLQKEKDSRRIYAKTINSATNCDGYKQEGITFPKCEAQAQLMQEVYSGSSIDPLEIEYIEAHVTGTAAGDPVESRAIISTLRPNKSTKTIMFGCLKSNMGHTEGASGVCSLSKVCKIFQTGFIPPNINFINPNPFIEELITGIIQPVIKVTPFNGKYIGINSFGFGGANVHMIVEKNSKSLEDNNKLSYNIIDKLPRLINICNRTQEGINYTFGILESSKLSRDYLALLNKVSKIKPPGMNYRGYMIVDKDENNSYKILTKSYEKIDFIRPLWFVFSPLGCQWKSMGCSLLKFPIFKKTIDKLNNVMKEYGLNLIDVIKTSEFEDIVSTLVGITCIQIGIVDILRDLNIYPEGIIGHSIGEVCAAYADNCLSAEQAILTSYWIAKICKSIQKEEGSMAAIGLSYNEMKNMLPRGIDAACINSPDNVTISGNKDKIDKFILEMNEKNIFAKAVNSCGVAYHSSSIEHAREILNKKFKEFITNPKKRSKWLSCAVPFSKWNTVEIADSSYFANMTVDTVYFTDAIEHSNKDALFLEISPNAILLSLIKRNCPTSKCIGIMKKNSDNNSEENISLLNSIGKIYSFGYNPLIEKLYPEVTFPIACETPTLGHLIKWDHSNSWKITKYPEYFATCCRNLKYQIDLLADQFRFFSGHVIDGRILLPATGYLDIVWKQVVNVMGVKDTTKFPIIFENVQLYRATILNSTSPLTIVVNYDQQTKKFIFIEGDTICASGFAYIPNDQQTPKPELEPFIHSPEKLISNNNKSSRLTSKEVYRELRLCGYDYGLTFQGIESASTDGSHGRVRYDRNWVCFTDSMLQVTILASNTRQLSLPTYIEYLRCDPEILQNEVKRLEKEGKEPVLDVYFDKYSMIGATKGLVVKGLKATTAPRKVNNVNPIIEEQLFLPLDCTINEDINETKNYEEYIELCNLCLKKSDQQNNKIKDIVSMERDEHNLLRLLYTNELDNLMKNINQSYEKLNGDMIFTRGVRKILRSHIDIVAENISSNKLFVTEINSTSQIFFDEIIKTFNTYGIRAQVALVHPENSSSKGAKSIKWPTYNDFNIINLEKSDLIIFIDDRTEFISNKYPSLSLRAMLNKTYATLNNGCFMLIFYRKCLSKIEKNISTTLNLEKISFDNLNDLEKLAQEIGFIHISKLVFENWESLLLRKLDPHDQDKHIKIYITSDNYSWLDELKGCISDESIKRLWLIGNDPLSGVIGLVNCLRKEPLGNRIRCFYSVDGKSQLTDEIIKKDLVINCSNNNISGTYRYFAINDDDSLVTSKHNLLNIKIKGDLSSLKWFQSPYDYWSTKPKQINGINIGIIDVYYAALNFKDIMVATGRITIDAYPKGLLTSCILGMEYSGILNGRRVMGLLESQAFSTTILSLHTNFQFEIPENMTLEEGATIPVVYLTVYYSLIIRAKIRSGESILIHAGSGGVGQAAIAVCLARGLKVYTTVGTQAKREYLKSKFPQLQDSDFSNSRTVEFEDHIMSQTNGRGVDLVLNSLAEDKFKASVRCLAPFGRFIEIGKYDIVQNTPFEPLEDNKTLHVVCLAHLVHDIFELKTPASMEINDQLIDLMNNGLKNGEIVPLDRKIFERNQAEEAFRFMASGKHIGKVLIKIRDENDRNQVEVDRPLSVIGQTYFDPLKSYIVTGGLGGVGLELVNWLVQRGAINIIITSRTGVKNNYQKIILDRLSNTSKKFKIKLNVLVNEGLTYEANEELIDEAIKLAPVGGIFHLSMILHDAILPNQTHETFNKVCAPKIKTAIYLDAITRKKCPLLDYFVCFSSAASGKGNAGQSNYAFANSTLDRICDQRKKQGFHGLSIQWGAIGDVGIVAEMGGNDIILGGTLPQRIISCMETLDKFLQLSKNPLNQKIYSFNVGSTEITSYFSVCSSIVLADSKKLSLGGKDNLLRTICHILGVKDYNTLDQNITLSDLGLDSLMAVEIKQALERDYDIIFSTQEIRNLRIKDINEIGKKVVNKTKEIDNEVPILINPSDLFFTISNLAGKPILFLPPIEGDFKLMIPLTKHITRPVTGINWTEDFDKCNDLRQVACLLADRLRCHLPNTNEYDIVGYSFGGILAIELGLRIQELIGENAIKRIILLDTSPEYLKYQIIKLGQKTQIIQEDEAELEALIGYVGSFITIENVIELRLMLQKMTKEERIAKMSHLVSARGIKCDPEDLTTAFKRFTHKMRLIYNYKITRTLNADVTLIRCKELNFNPFEVNFDDDYGLNKLVNGRIEVIQYSGNHKTFLSENVDDISTLMDARLNIVNFA